MTRAKTFAKGVADRSAYLDCKLDDYRARLIADPEYDRLYVRRRRLLSYRNHVFKALNRELRDAARKKMRK
ncbi:hypothetical protein [Paenibacillus sp. FSL R7-0128]|uniref:hypothetical protein n=1 Tax=Paenibacillus sp. FSL R7-0128 TaxID=2954529 RepID=UPI0030FB5FFB